MTVVYQTAEIGRVTSEKRLLIDSVLRGDQLS